ncbi:MAG: hypothetical protein ACE5Q6_01255 [Dehalococcoidia bacterium]
MLLVFMVLAVPLVLAATQAAGQLSRNSSVYDTRLTDSYDKASDVESTIAEILDPEAVSIPDIPKTPEPIDWDSDNSDDIEITKIAPVVNLDGQGLVVSQEVEYGGSVPLDVNHTFTYTITARNEGNATLGLESLTVFLPPGLSYDQTIDIAATSQPFNPPVSLSAAPQTEAGSSQCAQTPQKVTWSFPWNPNPPDPLDDHFTDSHIHLDAQHHVTLTFEASGTFAALNDGTYYSRASAEYRAPWNNSYTTPIQVTTPFGAPFNVETGNNQVCGFDLLVLIDESAGPVEVLGQAVDIDYHIEIENISGADLLLERLYDLLPPGYEYKTDTSNWTNPPIVLEPTKTPETPGCDKRCLMTWTLNPPHLMTSGDIIELDFVALGTVEAGVSYYNEVSADFTSTALNGRADIVLALDNSVSICDGWIFPCPEPGLPDLKQAANDIIDGFKLEETGGNIHIGVTRFTGCSLSVAEMSDDPDQLKTGLGGPQPTTAELAENIDTSATSFMVSDGSLLAAGKTIKIGAEEMYIPVLTGDTVDPVIRGLNGTMVVSHNGGDHILMYDSQSCLPSDGFGTVTVTNSGGIDDAETVLEVSGVGDLQELQTIIVDGEHIKITSINGTNLTVLRARDNTLGADHQNGSRISIFREGPELGVDNLQPGLDLIATTNILAALYGAAAHFQSGDGEREDAPNSIIIISDFQHVGDEAQLLTDIAAAKGVIDAEIFAVGVGDWNPVIRDALASEPVAAHTWDTSDFSELLNIVGDIVAGIPQVITAEGGASEATAASGGTLYDIESLDSEGTKIETRVLSRRDPFTQQETVEILSWQEK